MPIENAKEHNVSPGCGSELGDDGIKNQKFLPDFRTELYLFLTSGLTVLLVEMDIVGHGVHCLERQATSPPLSPISQDTVLLCERFSRKNFDEMHVCTAILRRPSEKNQHPPAPITRSHIKRNRQLMPLSRTSSMYGRNPYPLYRKS